MYKGKNTLVLLKNYKKLIFRCKSIVKLISDIMASAGTGTGTGGRIPLGNVSF